MFCIIEAVGQIGGHRDRPHRAALFTPSSTVTMSADSIARSRSDARGTGGFGLRQVLIRSAPVALPCWPCNHQPQAGAAMPTDCERKSFHFCGHAKPLKTVTALRADATPDQTWTQAPVTPSRDTQAMRPCDRSFGVTRPDGPSPMCAAIRVSLESHLKSLQIICARVATVGRRISSRR